MKSKTFILAALAASVVGCSKPQEVPDYSHTIEFTTVTGRKVFILEDTAREFGHDSDIAFRDSATLILPERLFDLDVSNLRDTIMAIAFDTISSDPRQAMLAYFESSTGELGYSFVEADSLVNENDIDGFNLIQADVYSMTTQRLTYKITQYTYYPGAAHGMYRGSFITYDLTRGDIITLNELFTPEGLEELPAIISRRAQKLARQIGPTDISALPANGDFYISIDDEIVFVYQPYEVASYAQGIIYVPFYPYDLTDLFTARGKALFNLQDADDQF